MSHILLPQTALSDALRFIAETGGCPDTIARVNTLIDTLATDANAALVSRLKASRTAKRAATGRCEGRKPAPAAHAAAARSYRASNPTASLRAISAHLASQRYLSPSNQPYSPSSIKVMLASGHTPIDTKPNPG